MSIPKPLFFSLRVLLVIVPCVLFSAVTVLGQGGSSLEGQIDRYIKSLRSKGVIRSDERTAWVVYDFASGAKLVSINETASLQAASMIKPFLALAFFHQVEAGKLSYGSTSVSMVEKMIQLSDNDATNWVMKQVGGPAAAQTLLKRYYPSLCQQISIVEYIPSGGRTYRNKASAADYTRFLSALWRGELPRSREILRVMALPGKDRLYTDARCVPSGTKVYNKTGSTAMCCGDMGILVAKGKNGESVPYAVIGIIESGKRNTSYGPWISKRADVIREVSNLVYLEMKKRHSL
jgi:beta-lactamase class A